MKFFSKNFINIVFKTCRNIEKAKQHNLILKIVAFDLKNNLSFIIFSSPHLIINTDYVKLRKTVDLI